YQNFYDMLDAAASSSPNKTVIFIDDRKVTYKEFLHKVDAFARFLEIAGAGVGDRVALIAPNSEEFVISVYAATKIGAVVVPINNMLKANEYEYILNDCEAKLLITSQQYLKEVQELPATTKVEKTVWVDEAPQIDSSNIVFDEILETHRHGEESSGLSKLDDMAIIFYTSGTTGHPKGAMMSYRNIFSNMIAGSERFDVTHKDRFIVYLPMFHAFTFTVMLLIPFYSRGSFVIIPKLLPFSNIIKQTLLKRVTIFLGVPDVYNALIKVKLPWYFMWFNSIRVFISGASALSEDTLNRFNQKFKRATMLEGYGLSECSPVVSVNPMDKQKPMSIGLALRSYEVKIVDDEMLEVPLGQVGEIIVKGDNVMMGYLNRPEATEETIINGWLRTGDLGKMDDEGYIYIVDRMTDLIISKGINIYPRQIEEELMKLEYIRQGAVIGVKDPNSGEVPVAYVELEDEVDRESVTPNRIKKDLKAVLANFKVPKNVVIVDELPKTATGKVLKRKIKETYRN
ncbi:MAG: long-chain-fatty-acid--CoA ligase, partial [Sulfurimonadaceae bacterium]